MCHQDSVFFVNCSHISTGVVPSKGKRQAAPVNAKAALLVASGATRAAFARILGFGTTVGPSGKALDFSRRVLWHKCVFFDDILGIFIPRIWVVVWRTFEKCSWLIPSCWASLTTEANCSDAKVAMALVVGWSNIKVLGNLRRMQMGTHESGKTFAVLPNESHPIFVWWNCKLKLVSHRNQ